MRIVDCCAGVASDGTAAPDMELGVAAKKATKPTSASA
jgi:hypothetical protein